MLCKAERNTRRRGESGEKLERKIDAMPSKYRQLADKEFNARRNLNVVKSVEIAVKSVRRIWKLGSERFGATNDKRSGNIAVKNILRAGQLLGKNTSTGERFCRAFSCSDAEGSELRSLSSGLIEFMHLGESSRCLYPYFPVCQLKPNARLLPRLGG